jgi:putative flavoprotein involved in K+ transport
MAHHVLDAVVVGAGHAGLAISYYLNHYNLRQIVLERGRIGESWRSQRWDSFRLNTPNRFNSLTGDDHSGISSDLFTSAGKFVTYLESYANRFLLPVQEHARVISVTRDHQAFRVVAIADTTLETYECHHVVIASGGQNEGKTPTFAAAISPRVTQYHAGEYRSASELPDGAVLVVGSAQSGLQIAEDLVDAGRNVYLSSSAVGRVPRRYRGNDIVDWLMAVGFFDATTDNITNPKELESRQPQVSGVGPRGHTVSLQFLARKGVVVLGKIASASGSVVTFQANAKNHIQFGDQVSQNIKTLIDRYIMDNHLSSPPAEPDPADDPDNDGAAATNLLSLDLAKENVSTIIWATGFTGNFEFLQCDATDARGMPIHQNGIARVPGLYFLGLPWLRKRKSGIICGMYEDAAFIAEHLTRAGN